MGGGSSAGTHQPLLRGHHLSIRAPEVELYVYPHRYLDGVVEVDGEERDDALGTLLQYYNSSEHSRRIEEHNRFDHRLYYTRYDLGITVI